VKLKRKPKESRVKGTVKEREERERER